MERVALGMSGDLLTNGQAARLIGVSSFSVYYYEERGYLTAVQTPLGRLYPRDQVEQIKQHREARAKRSEARRG